MLKGKTILLGVCACTPAYRANEIASELKRMGADVKVILTKNATHFVTPLTLQGSSGNPVQIDQFESPLVWDRNYQSWVLSGDLLLLAPASANILGKAANGIADDLLSTTIMSFEGPKVVAMNMNPMQYRNAAVQRNVRQLAEDGFYFVNNGVPENPARMPAIEKIIDAVLAYLG